MPIGRYENPEIRRARNAGRDRGVVMVSELRAGQIHRDQHLPLGFGARAIDHRIAAGRLHRNGWKTYGVGHRRGDREARLHAAVMTCGDGAALSYRAGAAWLGILPILGGPLRHRPRRRLGGGRLRLAEPAGGGRGRQLLPRERRFLRDRP